MTSISEWYKYEIRLLLSVSMSKIELCCVMFIAKIRIK